MPPETLREQQFAFARHLRDPEVHPAPTDLDARRLRVYRDLFFNNIEGLLRGSFPVISATLGPAEWKNVVQRYFAAYRSRTPLFPRIAAEFVDHLRQQTEAGVQPAWLAEMAHYEWIEQALFTSDAQPPSHDPDGDLFDGIPVFSPWAEPLVYRWPVLQIGPGQVPSAAPDAPTLLLVWRNASQQVSFSQIGPFAFHLLTSVRNVQRTGRSHLFALAVDAQADPALIQAQGLDLLEQMRKQGLVLGTLSDAQAP